MPFKHSTLELHTLAPTLLTNTYNTSIDVGRGATAPNHLHLYDTFCYKNSVHVPNHLSDDPSNSKLVPYMTMTSRIGRCQIGKNITRDKHFKRTIHTSTVCTRPPTIQTRSVCTCQPTINVYTEGNHHAVGSINYSKCLTTPTASCTVTAITETYELLIHTVRGEVTMFVCV